MDYIIEKEITNGVEREYKVVNGTYYAINTPNQVITVLENARANNKRIRIFYGDSSTGNCWFEEYDIIGHVGRSAGRIHVPILLPNKNSDGGGAILSDCIVRITIDKRNVYKHPKFHVDKMTVEKTSNGDYPYSVLIDGKSHANFKTEKKASQWVEFMKGDRNRVF